MCVYNKISAAWKAAFSAKIKQEHRPLYDLTPAAFAHISLAGALFPMMIWGLLYSIWPCQYFSLSGAAYDEPYTKLKEPYSMCPNLKAGPFSHIIQSIQPFYGRQSSRLIFFNAKVVYGERLFSYAIKMPKSSPTYIQKSMLRAAD